MEAIRFSILLSLLFFAGYANHSAEENVKEHLLNNMPFVKLKEAITDEHFQFMRRALDMHKSETEKNGSILSASLIVKDGKVIGEGIDKSTHSTDPSAHAAMVAVREACINIGRTSLKGYTLYSTAELCPMCVSLLYVADIDKIIYCTPSEEGTSAEALMGEKIYGALRQNIGERPIPEIFVPYELLDGAIHSATDPTIY